MLWAKSKINLPKRIPGMKGLTIETPMKNVSAYKVKNNGMREMKKKQNVFLFVMLIIPILHWFVFWLYVNFDTILLAFQTKTGSWTTNNFQMIFHDLKKGEEISIALVNTLKYFVNNLVIMVLALFISYFMYRNIKGTRFFRVVFYLPGIISAVALTTVFSDFISPNGAYGALMRLLGKGDEIKEFLANSKYATNTILIYCIWTGFGTNLLLFTGAMKRIPIEVIESSKMDGCGMLREFFTIILPLIWPTISTLIILNCTSIFTASGPILLFTYGEYKTTTIGFWIFRYVYEYNNYNIVSAAGLLFTCLGVPFILIVRKLIDKVPTADY